MRLFRPLNKKESRFTIACESGERRATRRGARRAGIPLKDTFGAALRREQFWIAGENANCTRKAFRACSLGGPGWVIAQGGVGTSLEIPLEQDLDDKLRRQLLAYGQRYDLQTGFLNYQAFQESLAGWMRTAKAGREVALVWIEVQNLRREFALLGSKGAESLIVQVAEALRSAVDPGALLGRFTRAVFGRA